MPLHIVIARPSIAAACLLGLVVCAPAGASAAPAAPVASPSGRVAGEPTTLQGGVTVKARKPRKVVLQVRRGARWVTGSTGRTSTAGRYSFTTRMPATTTSYRVVAPKGTYTVKKKGVKRRKKLAAQTSGARVLTPTRQSASISTSSAPVFQTVGTSVSESRSTSSTSLTRVRVDARFTPARPGRVVRVELSSAGRWVSQGVARQDASGGATFLLAPSTAPRTVRAVAVAANGAPAALSAPSTMRGWQHAYTEDFAGRADWTTRGENVVAAGRPGSVPRDDMAVASGGTLNLRATRSSACTPPRVAQPGGCFVNAQVENRTKSWTYGTFSARIKFQAAPGQHGAFWSQPTGAGPGAEIDVAEFYGNQSSAGGLAQNVHSAGRGIGSPKMDTRRLQTGGRPWSADYHVYSVEWTREGYTFRVDGRLIRRVTSGVSSVPQHLILSLLTSDYESAAFRPDTMKVDWVQVWR